MEYIADLLTLIALLALAHIYFTSLIAYTDLVVLHVYTLGAPFVRISRIHLGFWDETPRLDPAACPLLPAAGT